VGDTYEECRPFVVVSVGIEVSEKEGGLGREGGREGGCQ